MEATRKPMNLITNNNNKAQFPLSATEVRRTPKFSFRRDEDGWFVFFYGNDEFTLQFKMI